MHIRWVPPIAICDDGTKKLYVEFYNSKGSVVIYMYMVSLIAMCDGLDLILFMPCSITSMRRSYYGLLRIGSIQQFKTPIAIFDGKSMKH